MSEVDKLLNNIEWLTPEHRAEFVAALLALLEAEAVDVVPVDLTLNDRFKAISLERVRELFGE